MVSVIMPVYNSEQFLRDAIESVLRQTMNDFELLIINDGSTDSSEDIILSFSDRRIRYIKQENIGEAGARNTGLRNARGEYVVWQDADDISLPNRLSVLLSVIEETGADFAHSDMLIVNERKEPIGYWSSLQIRASSVNRFLLKKGTPYNNPTMMVRKAVFSGRFFDTELIIGTDTDMISRFAGSAFGIHVPQPLLFYRRHGTNLSGQGTYEIQAHHVIKYLKDHTLDKLCPEINWDDRDHDRSNNVRALMIVGLHLSRRGLKREAKLFFERAQALMQDSDEEHFVRGILALERRSYAEAIHHFRGVGHQDYVVKNYLGETLAYLGDFNAAFDFIMQAVLEKPDYEDAISNLRSIGCAKGLVLTDVDVSKFILKY